MRKLILISVLSLGSAVFGDWARADAQETGGRWSVGVKGGPSILSQDYTDHFEANLGPIVGGMVSYHLTERFGIGLHVEWEKHEIGQEAGLGFGSSARGKFQSISIIPVAEFHPVKNRVLSPYLSIGVGININSTSDIRGPCSPISSSGFGTSTVIDCELAPDDTLAVRVASGADLFLGRRLALNIEAAWKFNSGNFADFGSGSGFAPTLLDKNFEANVAVILVGVRYYFDDS